MQTKFYGQLITAINLQHTSMSMSDKKCCAHGIAMDSVTKRSHSFVVVCMEICATFNFGSHHLLAISLTESHTCTAMLDI